MRERVVLYNPRAVFYTMPLALVAIGSALDRRRHDVVIVDARLEDDPHAALVEAAAGARCVGMTVLTGAPIRDALAASRALKRSHPGVPVVWGGWHPSLFPTETLAEPSVSVTVQGQGEETFPALVDALASGADLGGIGGIAFRRDGVPVRNAPRPLADMDALAPHDYDLIDVDRYFGLKGQRQLDYVTSTGCHFRCAFCADPFVYGRKWTAVSPARIGEEIERLWRRHRFTELSFQDETFFTYRARVVAIAEEILRRGLRFAWTATLRADQAVRLSEADLGLAVRSGLRRVMIGVESGSQEMLDWMQKDTTVEQVLEAAARCVRHDIGAIFPFIVGFPGESNASVRATLALVTRLRAMSPAFETPIFYFKPYPGSRITSDAVHRGYELPATLEAWAGFDFVGSSGPWVAPELERLVERFKFYNRFAWGPETLRRRPLQRLARWRVRRDFYRVPIEKVVVERLLPQPQLS